MKIRWDSKFSPFIRVTESRCSVWTGHADFICFGTYTWEFQKSCKFLLVFGGLVELSCWNSSALLKWAIEIDQFMRLSRRSNEFFRSELLGKISSLSRAVRLDQFFANELFEKIISYQMSYLNSSFTNVNWVHELLSWSTSIHERPSWAHTTLVHDWLRNNRISCMDNYPLFSSYLNAVKAYGLGWIDMYKEIIRILNNI